MGWYIFDLDGTLADHRHRLWLIEGNKKNFDAYHDLCHLDKPLVNNISILKDLLFIGHDIEIWTGRSEVVRAKTETWLENVAGIDPKHLYNMRPEKCYDTDFDLKKRWLDACVQDRKTLNNLGNKLDTWPTACFDDRDRVVDMWRNAGVTCYQVERGDF